VTFASINRLIEVIGTQATLDLVRGYGGRRLYIRKQPRPDSAVALRIGEGPARQLSAYFGGATIELPAERNALIRLRDQSILERLEAGASPREVAAEHGLSPRHVRHIRDVQSRRD